MTELVLKTNLFDVLRANFPKDRTATALILSNGSRVSYGELENQSGKMANKISNVGARAGDRVLVQVDKTPNSLALYLACLRAGVIIVPLNTAYGKVELDYFIDDAQPTLIVCEPSSPLLEKKTNKKADFVVLSLDGNGEGTLLDGFSSLTSDFETSKRGGNQTAALLYTSGTTGKPKGAMITHDNLISNAITLKKSWGFTKDDILLHALPTFHVHGLFVATNTAMMSGCQIQFLAKFNLDEVLEFLPSATVMMGVPTFYTRLLSDDRFDKDLCSNLRLFVSGSAPLLADTFRSFHLRTGHKVLERYGMTETSMITSNPLTGDRVAGSVGQPLPDITVRIVDPMGKSLTTNAVGAIEVSGPNVFEGYWRNLEKTVSEFCSDGFFKTGDIGLIDEKGFLHIIGRDKDMIISGGLNIYPKEVEEFIDQLFGVQETAVIGLPHPDFGEGVVAIVVRNSETCTSEFVIKGCGDGLASFKCPKVVLFVDQLPRNAMGKVEKAKLREMYSKALDC